MNESVHGNAPPQFLCISDQRPDQSLVRTLQSQLVHLRTENEGLRRQLDREKRGNQRMPTELKWLIYFRAPATKA